jgi:phosphatidylserine/phosphatidylglycerophosphate/cardiolipin synthase-like enzyme
VILASSDDAVRAAVALRSYLAESTPDSRAALLDVGLAQESVDAVSLLLPPGGRAELCDYALAWALGRRALNPDSWEPVVGGVEFQTGVFERHTGETLVAIISSAREAVRLYAPYVDAGGLEALRSSIAAAAGRGARITLAHLEGRIREQAVAQLVAAINPLRIGVVRIPKSDVFPHLKLVSADGHIAYVGSANLTWTGITSNLEMGTLVEGEGVRSIDRMFDLLCSVEVAGGVLDPGEGAERETG